MTIVDMYGREVSLKEAISGSLTNSNHDSGKLEDIERDIRSLCGMLTAVVIRLAEKNLLNEIELNDLFSFYYSVKE